MFISALKRRWPVLTGIVALFLYISSNYDLRGLDGLRLEPRNIAEHPSASTADQRSSWPAAFPPSPRLPTTAWPSNSEGASLANPVDRGGQSGTAVTSSSLAAGRTESPTTSLPGGSLLGTGEYGGTAASTLGRYPPSALEAGSGEAWRQTLSFGEKLGVLETAGGLNPVLAASNSAAGLTGSPATQTLSVTTAQAGHPNTIRIASFNTQGLGMERQRSVAVVELLTGLLAQFEVIALQNIRSSQDDLLPELVSQLNRRGRKYDFMIGPRVGRGQPREQLAFIFDTERLETDRFQLYTVQDPEDMLQCEPLVGWFRARGVSTEEAFTFTLVNVHVDADLMESELRALPVLVEAIAADGRGEDDLILAGDFSAASPRLGGLSSIGMRIVLEDIATTTRGTHQLDNMAFPANQTTEFTGRSGAYDFLRQFNLTLEQAVQISEHLPIWAEFSIIEGGRPAQVGSGQVGESFQSELRRQKGIN